MVAAAAREAVQRHGAHILTETNRHAGHADILREQLDGTVGTHPSRASSLAQDGAIWEKHRAQIEAAARVAQPAQ